MKQLTGISLKNGTEHFNAWNLHMCKKILLWLIYQSVNDTGERNIQADFQQTHTWSFYSWYQNLNFYLWILLKFTWKLDSHAQNISF